MCGITGFIDKSFQTSTVVLKNMRDTLMHRGPDSKEEILLKSSSLIGLAHTRLSILDLSHLGHQPMTFENLTITYNGEVYNFQEIKEELITFGYKFDSNSDTEVILKAFHKWREKSVERFRGMFTFAIYDKTIDKMFIFRDRAGVKPLYYYKKDDLFLFGSEVKAFHKHPNFEKTINKKALPYYFRFGYIPAPLSVFENTYKLKQGNFLEIKCNSLEIKEIPYWSTEEKAFEQKFDKSEDTILKELEEILIDSFKLRMVSDVPVGVFLSGGIDSTLVTALLQKDLKIPLRTFTIGFEDKKYDEATYAKDIANYLKTDHTEYYCTQDDMLNIIKDLPNIYDEPFGDSSAIPTILVSKLAKEKVSVVLSGDGGDETFIGYSKYFALNKIAQLQTSKIKSFFIKKAVNTLTPVSIEKINDLLPNKLKQRNIKDKFQKFQNAINSSSLEEMFFKASSYVDNKTLKLILKDSHIEDYNTNLFSSKKLSFLEKMSLTDYKTFLPDDVLVKVDRASMSVSLEAREPLLDHKIIEFASKIPENLKYKNNNGKYLLKKILYKYVPEKLIERPKSGFQVPLLEWLKGDLKNDLEYFLSESRLEKSGIYNTQAVLKIKQDLYNGKDINLSVLWFVLMFEMWREKWLRKI